MAWGLRVVLGMLVALGGCSGVKGESDGDESKPPTVAQVPGPGLTPGTYRVRVVGARVSKSKQLGLKWDVVGPAGPDLGFEVSVNGEIVASCSGTNDARESQCAPKDTKTFSLSATTTITMAVVDRDIGGHDAAGEAHISGLTTAGIAGKPLPMTPNGKHLRRAWVQLQPVTPPAGLWSTYKNRVIGLVGGVAAALLILVAFKGFWFDPKHYLRPQTIGTLADAQRNNIGELGEAAINKFDGNAAPATTSTPPQQVQQVVKVRCPFCAALLDETSQTCNKCGGNQ